MTFTGDERAQSIQVGAVLLFGVLIIAFSSYQAFAVPEQNREVEFNHNQQVQTQMQDLRNAIVSVPGQPSQQAVSIQLGTRYPSRLVATNPGPPSGLLYTDGTTDESQTLSVQNAEALNPETADYWDGTTTREYNTGAIAYKPEYNVYGGAPETVYEHSVVYNQFREGNITRSEQAIVDGRDITLVALNGSMSRSESGSVSVDVQPESQSSRTVRVTNATATSNVSVSFLTRLPASKWETLLANEEYVVDVIGDEGPGSLNRVTIVFERGQTYRLKMAKAGVGTGVTDESAAYMTNIDGDGASVSQSETTELTLEVRDRFNSPPDNASETTVEAVVDGSGTVDGAQSSTQTPDENGQVTFTYKAPSGTTGTQDINISYVGVDGTFDASTPQNVSMTVDVQSSSSSLFTGNLTYNGDAEAYDGPDGGTTAGGVNFSVTNDFDQRVTITGLTVAPENDEPDELSDEATPNGQPTRSEVYVAGDREDGYVDIDGGSALPAEFDFDTQGFDRGEDAVVTSGAVADVYLYEFYNTTRAENLNMVGEPLNVTVHYHLQRGGLSGERTYEMTPVADAGTNQPPTASFTYSPTSPTTSDDIMFDGTGSSDTDGSITSYEWDFGDGTTATGSTVMHSYDSSGDYTVTLTVTDDDGATDTSSQTVSVGSGGGSNSPPSASIDSVTDANTGDDTYDVTVDWSASDSDGNLDSGTITVNDDGPGGNTATADISSSVSGNSASGSETLTIELSGPPPKQYDVTLIISDTDGASDTDEDLDNNP